MDISLPEKFWCKPQNGQLAPKSLIFKMAENHHVAHFSYVVSKFKCQQLIYRWKGSFIGINIVLRTRVQKLTYFELLIENRRDIFIKVVGFFVKNRQDMKK